MKRNRFLTLFLLLFAMLFVQAQEEVKIISFEENITDLSGSVNPRKDAKGAVCALVKVLVLADKVSFDGVVVGDVERKGNEYWVYMRPGAARLSVQIPNMQPLDVSFEDFGVESLSSKVTYALRLDVPDDSQVELSDSMQYIVFQVFPQDAVVVLDGDTLELEDGTVQKRVKLGQHRYSVSRQFFSTENGVANVEKEEAKAKRIVLSALRRTLTVYTTEFNMIPINYDNFAKRESREEEDGMRSFLMADIEVPQTLWHRVMAGYQGPKTILNPSVHSGSKLPVENVSYEDCMIFLQRLNDYTHFEFRLPTEQEWEYAARCSVAKDVQNGKLDAVSWYEANSKDKPHPVGTKEADSLGIKDLYGNVEEWCISEDGPVSKGGNYSSSPADFDVKKRGKSSKDCVVGLRLVI